MIHNLYNFTNNGSSSPIQENPGNPILMNENVQQENQQFGSFDSPFYHCPSCYDFISCLPSLDKWRGQATKPLLNPDTIDAPRTFNAATKRTNKRISKLPPGKSSRVVRWPCLGSV